MRVGGLAVSLVIGIAAVAAAPRTSATDYQFSWGHPRPQGNSLGGAAFEDDLVGYAVGNRGVVLKTGDGGASWNQVWLMDWTRTD